MRYLTDRERLVLDLEARVWPADGLKDRVVAEQLDLSPVRYHQMLNRLLAEEAAEAYAPVLVHRLRRIRAARTPRRLARPPQERSA